MSEAPARRSARSLCTSRWWRWPSRWRWSPGLRLLVAISVFPLLVTAPSVEVEQLPDPHAHVLPVHLLSRGHFPVNRTSPKSRTLGASALAERIFLDFPTMCFDRPVSVVAVDFYIARVVALQESLLRWHILRPIPSHSEYPTQWFRLEDAWPVAPSDRGPSAAAEAYPTPGAYRLTLSKALKLDFGDCIGWSLRGGAEEPFAFDEVTPSSERFDENATKVAWAESSEGLHDVVELFVKMGAERPPPHISWTGLLQRTYSVRLLYKERVALSDTVTAPAAREGNESEAPREPSVPGGNPACWRDGYSFEMCCVQEIGCWDMFYSYERCCSLTTRTPFPDAFRAPDPGDHYELRHLLHGNKPNLGPLQDDEALLLYSLVRATRPLTIVEFGTAQGFSGLNWLHAIADEPDALIFSYDIVPYPAARQLEDSDARFVFVQKSQADFDAADVRFRMVDLALFDAGHLVEYSLKAFERLLPSLSPTAVVAVHDTGLHVLDHGSGAPAHEEGLPFSLESCARRPGGAAHCRRFPGCHGNTSRGFCVGRAHRPSERRFVRRLLQRWPQFRPLHLHSRRVFRHGLTLLQRGDLWDVEDEDTENAEF